MQRQLSALVQGDRIPMSWAASGSQEKAVSLASALLPALMQEFRIYYRLERDLPWEWSWEMCCFHLKVKSNHVDP